MGAGEAWLGRVRWRGRSSATGRQRYLALVAFITAAGVGSTISASPTAAVAPGVSNFLTPSAAFLQVGMASDAEMLIFGATWNWAWQRDTSLGRITGYSEASFGRWRSEVDEEGALNWVTQWGVTPVLRLHPNSWGGPWFVEVGIGANLLVPIYRTSSKRFSTTFKFGDHLAIGRQFGEGGRHELALRFQHFSNAGIRSPNPGENFLQLRYIRRF